VSKIDQAVSRSRAAASTKSDRAKPLANQARALVVNGGLSPHEATALLLETACSIFADEAGVVVRALTRMSGRTLGGALACPGQGVFAEVVVGHFVRTRRLQVGRKGAPTSSKGSSARQRTPPRCSRARRCA
jgi:hypothetical protein